MKYFHLTFWAYLGTVYSACDSGYYRPFILLPCKPCQEEDVVYFGNNIKEYAPIPRKLSLADCQNECAKVDSCQYWSYHQPQEKCFLKDHRNSKTTLDYLSKGYISGIKKCPNSNPPRSQSESQIEIGGQSFTFLPSTFGKQFFAGDKLEGKVVELQEAKLCAPITYNATRRYQIALVERGDCQFAQKAINAQAAGYSALIILDTKNATKFSRLIASSSNQIPAAFLRIPVLFLLPPEAAKLRTYFNQDIVIEKLGENMKSPKDIIDYLSEQSPLTLVVFGVCALVALIFICAIQVCCCSCGKKRRNRVLPDTCPNSEGPGDFAPRVPDIAPYHLVENPMSEPCYQDTELICPVCLEVPFPPKKIFQCSQGHTICDECLSKIEKKCPTCRESWENTNLPVRNRMAESMIPQYFRVSNTNQNISQRNSMVEIEPEINFVCETVTADLSPSAPPQSMSDEI